MAPEAVLLEGKILAQKIQEEIRVRVQALAHEKKALPKLRALQVTTHPSSEWYLNQQEKLAAKLGLQFERITPERLSNTDELMRELQNAHQAKEVAGIFITMPLPSNFDLDRVLLALDPRKDVEGIHPANLGLIALRRGRLIPPTAFSALKLIESTGVELRGKRAVLVGQSAVVGRPLQMLLGERRVTTVVCNSGTSSKDLEKYVSESDLVIGCAGQPGLIKGGWIKNGAIVIDVGTTEVNGKLVGDIEFEEAKKHASFITPVPGGVGPLTVTLLFENLIRAYDWQQAS